MGLVPLEAKLRYYKGIFDEAELKQHRSMLNNAGIRLVESDMSNQVIMFMDEFTSQISLIISNPLFQAYVLGLMTNASYEILKNSIIWMWKSTAGKKLTKLHMGGKQEEKEATFGIQIRIDNWTKIDFRLSDNVSDELKSESIDKAFKILNSIQKGEDRKPIDWFAKYSWDNHEWMIVNVEEEIHKNLLSQEE